MIFKPTCCTPQSYWMPLKMPMTSPSMMMLHVVIEVAVHVYAEGNNFRSSLIGYRLKIHIGSSCVQSPSHESFTSLLSRLPQIQYIIERGNFDQQREGILSKLHCLDSTKVTWILFTWCKDVVWNYNMGNIYRDSWQTKSNTFVSDDLYQIPWERL